MVVINVKYVDLEFLVVHAKYEDYQKSGFEKEF